MGYFSLRCFEPNVSRYIIIVLNVIVGLWGIIHWAYAGVTGNFKSQLLINAGTSTAYASIVTLANSTIGYYVITGIIQVLVTVLIMLIVFEVLGKDRQLLFVRGLTIALLVEFAFNFYIAVGASMNSSFYDTTFQSQLAVASTYTNSSNTTVANFYQALVSFVGFTKAEAIITWIIILPSILIILISVADQLFTEENVFKIIPNNQQVGTKSTVQVNPIPQSSFVEIKPQQQ